MLDSQRGKSRQRFWWRLWSCTTRLATSAARRPLRGSNTALPLYRVNERGDVQEIARLDLTYPDGCAAEFLADFDWPLDQDMRAGWFDGLAAN
ncbi:MAG: hypothetical protein Q8R49_07325 [Rhodoferax sp.]|nr:hypothetical protein [Rhodoferax sp.]